MEYFKSSRFYRTITPLSSL